MALKDIWTDKVDGVDDVLATDINSIAHSVISNEENIANQETTINGKVDSSTSSTGNESYARINGVNRVLPLSAKGDAGVVAWFSAPKNSGSSEPNGTLSGAMPENPYNFTPKQYVDGKIEPLERDIRALNEAALGTLYTFEVFTFTRIFDDLPNGVLANANIRYIGDVELRFLNSDNEEIPVGTASLSTVRLLDANNNILSEFSPSLDQYFEIPEGATKIQLIEGDIQYFEGYSDYNMLIFDFVVAMQVKVGA